MNHLVKRFVQIALPALLLASACSSQAQSAAKAAGSAMTASAVAGSVEGHVTCSDGNVPARGAKIRLIPIETLLPHADGARRESAAPPDSSADFDGYYSFPAVAPGAYIVDATRNGYSNDLELVRKVLDRYPPEDRRKLLATFPQVIVGGSSVGRVDVVLHRAGVISGKVEVDSGGTPGAFFVTATLVSSSLIGDADPKSGQKPVEFAVHSEIDDRGVYRIAGLPQGVYRLSTRISEGFYTAKPTADGNYAAVPLRSGTGDLTVFAPDALDAAASRLVRVVDGGETTDADLTIPMRRLHSIGGVITQSGAPVGGAVIAVRPEGKDAYSYGGVSMPDGAYRYDLLPSGAYTVEVTYPNKLISPTLANTAKVKVQLGETDIMDANVDVPLKAAK